MKKKLFDLSGKIDNSFIEVFETIADVAKLQSVPFFVIGATARDMILTSGYGIETKRATLDIDCGVQVSDWHQYKKLTEGLISRGKFESTNKAQRFSYKESFLIDIIPFGKIAGPDDSLSWPPDHETEMSTLSFEESYQHSLTVRLRTNPVLDIQFASLAGLALMKIISWNDNYSRRDKDAKDLLVIMFHYLDAGNQERLYNAERDLVGEDFDYTRASARLLGRDIATIANPKTTETVLEILNRETGEQDRYRLVEDMLRSGSPFNDDFDEKLQLLEELKSGFLDKL